MKKMQAVVAHPESDDLFSSDCDDPEEHDRKGSMKRSNSASSRTTDKISNRRRVDCNDRISCSSSIRNSVHSSDRITSLPNRSDDNSDCVLIEEWLSVSDHDGSRKKIGESNGFTKMKSDPWTSKQMSNIAKKFEGRRRIMKEIASRDEKFFTTVPDNDLDASEKKVKSMMATGAGIRKKADRAKLQGVACAASKAYFDALDLSPESKERRINEVSRIRVVAQRMPSTPENYWEVGFPSESEQRRRGLIKEVHVRNKKGRSLFH
ncbi:hypothetical protein KIN20_001524 [Parelaphostrongylus tenuis]|uniref:DNA endonuclease activator Ctp1 C-terminal domain-containing protein n=1 Tax=Parelaphostrongylus tenuis TaxID=148309 RepID=A0AAD5LYG9_PARTN|nr:hypothetical protein KIN20_001524 [Parelaphostrongylus tenuis]